MAALQRIALRGTPKATKQAARYTPAGGAERCGMCRHYVPSSSCARIEGPVSAAGWCQLYSQQVTWRPRAGQLAGLNPGFVPAGVTLDLSFMTPGALDPRVTFTRASTATYFDSTGTLLSATANTPRWDYDPVTHALRGLLIEESRTNAVTNSSTLSSFVPQNSSTAAAGITTPPGTTGGLRLTENATNSEHLMDFNFVPVASTVYVATVFAKANTRSNVQIQLRGATTWVSGQAVAVADLLAGTIQLTSGSGTATIQSVGNGWYRIGVIGTTVASPAGGCLIRLSLANAPNGGLSYLGDGASNAVFYGAQVEAATFSTSYIPTAGASATRAIDVCQIPTTGWFTPTAFSLQVETFGPFHTAGGAFTGISDATLGNTFYIGDDASPNVAVNYTPSGGGSVVDGVISRTAVNKICGAFSTIRLAVVANAQSVGSAVIASTPIPAATRLSLGNDPWSLTTAMCGHMRRARYWPRVLTNAELQSVTT